MKSAAGGNNGVPRHAGQGLREYLELWILLSRRSWASLVIIPADADGSTADIANGLAEIGQRLSYGPVTAITVSSLEFGSALALADLQQHLDRERRAGGAATTVPADARATRAAGDGTAEPIVEQAPPPVVPPDGPADPAAAGADKRPTEALVRVPPARLIISIPPVVTQPLGLAAAHESDAVVLAVRMNRSRMEEVRRTVELVGRDRVLGCFLVR